MNILERIYDLLHERNMMSSNENQIEYNDVIDTFKYDLEKAVEIMQEEVERKRKNRQYFRLTHEDLRRYENTTIDDVYIKYLPNGVETDIQIVIGERTMYVPLNAMTYDTIIEAVKKCYKLENE